MKKAYAAMTQQELIEHIRRMKKGHKVDHQYWRDKYFDALEKNREWKNAADMWKERAFSQLEYSMKQTKEELEKVNANLAGYGYLAEEPERPPLKIEGNVIHLPTTKQQEG